MFAIWYGSNGSTDFLTRRDGSLLSFNTEEAAERAARQLVLWLGVPAIVVKV